MPRRRRLVALVLIAAALLVGAGSFRLSGLWPGPALPPGATALRLSTKPAGIYPGYCPGDTEVPAARVAVLDNGLELLTEDGGQPLNVSFPHGWSAWRIDGVAELVSRDGNVVGREGDVLRHLHASLNDQAFLVCDGGA